MDQDTEITRKHLSTFKENTRGSLKNIMCTNSLINTNTLFGYIKKVCDTLKEWY